MKGNLSVDDRHFELLPGANIEKHINFPEVDQDGSESIPINKGTSDRQKQWQQEIEEGEREKNRLDKEDGSSMPMDNDDTIGVP